MSEHRITAAAADSGKRADRFLAEAFPAYSRSRVKTLIEEGRATRDGMLLMQPAEPVREGAVYVLDPPAPVPAEPVGQDIPLAILYEDDDLIVLDKPAGLVVHPAPGNEDGTLVNALIAHCGANLPGIGGELRPGIVHRLDKDTSGVMVVAKSELGMAALSSAFAARMVDREYLALCWGAPYPAADEIMANIGRDRFDRKRMAVRAGTDGKPALTRYRTLAQRDNAVALLACRLATGRTHQIRVHLSSIGHPIVGDPLYLRRLPPTAKLLPDPPRGALLDFPRQALHAASLGFLHPRTRERMSFHTDPPPDMAELLDLLGFKLPPSSG